MPRLYHPDLGVECEVPTDQAAEVLAESGWKPAPDPEPAAPGVVPEPVTYAPVKTKSKTKATTEQADPGGHD